MLAFAPLFEKSPAAVTRLRPRSAPLTADSSPRGTAIRNSPGAYSQTSLYRQWKQAQEDYNAAGARRDELPVTVARALLEDFEDYLPAS